MTIYVLTAFAILSHPTQGKLVNIYEPAVFITKEACQIVLKDNKKKNKNFNGMCTSTKLLKSKTKI